MELVNKQEVLDLLSDEQIRLDGWGETDAAMKVAKVRLAVNDMKYVNAIYIPEGTTRRDFYNVVSIIIRNMILSAPSIAKDGAVQHELWWNEQLNDITEFLKGVNNDKG